MKIGGNIQAYAIEQSTANAPQTAIQKQPATLESDSVVLSSKATELNNIEALTSGGHQTEGSISRHPPP
jgi:hypothetical protein